MRCRQCFAVHLLVLVERDSVNLHRSGRHHIRRFALLDETIEGGNIDLIVADDICGDIFASVGIVKRLHGGIFYSLVLANNSLHLLEFDAEAADLDLSVTTSDELDISVRQVTYYIAGAISAQTASGTERDERLGGFLGQIEVASTYLRTADEQFTHCADRQAVEFLVNNEQLQVIQRFADRGVLFELVHRIRRCEDRALRRTVAVMERVVGRRSDWQHFLSAHGQVFQAVIVAVHCELASYLRGHERVRHTFFVEVRIQVREVKPQVFGHDAHCRAAGESRIQIHHTCIEAERCVCRHLVGGLQVIVPVIPVAERYQIAVLEHHAFGHARRAGCIK